jgi:hypothetical protein
VKQNGDALEYVPAEHRTRELCLAALKQNGYAIEYVPVKHKTHELCLAAVKKDWGAFKHVPAKYNLCLIAAKNAGYRNIRYNKSNEVKEIIP